MLPSLKNTTSRNLVWRAPDGTKVELPAYSSPPVYVAMHTHDDPDEDFWRCGIIGLTVRNLPEQTPDTLLIVEPAVLQSEYLFGKLDPARPRRNDLLTIRDIVAIHDHTIHFRGFFTL